MNIKSKNKFASNKFLYFFKWRVHQNERNVFRQVSTNPLRSENLCTDLSNYSTFSKYFGLNIGRGINAWLFPTYLVPAFHWPLSFLQHVASLLLWLLNIGKTATQTLHNLPAVLYNSVQYMHTLYNETV